MAVARPIRQRVQNNQVVDMDYEGSGTTHTCTHRTWSTADPAKMNGMNGDNIIHNHCAQPTAQNTLHRPKSAQLRHQHYDATQASQHGNADHARGRPTVTKGLSTKQVNTGPLQVPTHANSQSSTQGLQTPNTASEQDTYHCRLKRQDTTSRHTKDLKQQHKPQKDGNKFNKEEYSRVGDDAQIDMLLTQEDTPSRAREAADAPRGHGVHDSTLQQ